MDVHDGAPEVEDDSLLNPAVIVEVYSDETEAFDRGEKFARYRRSDTLRKCILVSQHELRVELFHREGERWRFGGITGPAGVLRIETLGCQIALRDLYEGVEVSE